jgi:hypothetical protein
LTFGKSPYCLHKSISRLVAWTSADSGAEKIDRIGSSFPICPSQRFNIAFGRSKESKLSRVTQPVAGMFANVNVGRPWTYRIFWVLKQGWRRLVTYIHQLSFWSMHWNLQQQIKCLCCAVENSTDFLSWTNYPCITMTFSS